MRIFSLGTYNLIVGVVQVRNEDLIDLLFAVSADLTDIAHQLRCLPPDGCDGLLLAGLVADDVTRGTDPFAQQVRAGVHAVLVSLSAVVD